MRTNISVLCGLVSNSTLILTFYIFVSASPASAQCCGGTEGEVDSGLSAIERAPQFDILKQQGSAEIYATTSDTAKAFAKSIAGAKGQQSPLKSKIRAYLSAVTNADSLALRNQPATLQFSESKKSIFNNETYLKNAEKLLEDPEESRMYRIVGGVPDQSTFPECVACGWEVDGFGDWCCTGTLVATNIVITAGHCFDCVNEGVGGRVLFGRSVADSNGKIVKVKKAYRHPGYGVGAHNDLTVLVLQEDVTDVQPRALAPLGTLEDSSISYVRAAGFGTTNFDGDVGYGIRRMVNLPLASRCSGDSSDSDFGCDSGLEFVAGQKALDKDTCRGDSGGPVYVKLSGDWYLIGATSRATRFAPRTCGDGGIYVRLDVAEYRNWLKSIPDANWADGSFERASEGSQDATKRAVSRDPVVVSDVPTAASKSPGAPPAKRSNADNGVQAPPIARSAPPSDLQDSITARITNQLRAEKARLYFRSNAFVAPTTGEKVIYGEDNRLDIFALPDGVAKDCAASTCILTSRSQVFEAGGVHGLLLQDYRQFGLPACSNERFRKQKVGGWCSGFLVGRDIVVTAGHCCEPSDDDAEQIAFVFGFYAQDDATTPSALEANQIYFGKKVLKHRLSNDGDFAVIQLDRPVSFPGAKPLKIRRSGQPSNGQAIGMIGYPSGLAAKASFGDETQISEVQDVWLRTNLDAYGGNSGSMVCDVNGVVEGILVRGNQDFKVHNNTCFFSNRLIDSEGGEYVTRASVFVDFIPEPDE